MMHLHVQRNELEVANWAIDIPSFRLLYTLDEVMSINQPH